MSQDVAFLFQKTKKHGESTRAHFVLVREVEGMQEKVMEQASVSTQRLYYEDSKRKEFTARVVACEAWKDGYRVALDRTAFFPEGGGQFGDIGWLGAFGEATVFDTQEENGVIWHMTDKAFEAGTVVTGKLDFEERFMRMQQHTGEHMISGIVHERYGLNNVGFHLGNDITTLDFDGELTPEQVRETELLVNRAVFADLPVEILYPAKEELADLPYRSKIDIEGQVRIVQISGIDTCACCAPHVYRTGEVGLVKILSCDRHRGGCRMVMAAGIRALADYAQKQESVTGVSVALSAKPEAIVDAVLHQKKQMQKMREQLNLMQASCLEQMLSKITPDQQNVCIFVEDFDTIAVRNFVNNAMERCGGICAAFVGNDENGYHYILGSRQQDVREFAKGLNGRFQGKGGGRPEMVQGSLRGAEKEIRKLFDK